MMLLEICIWPASNYDDDGGIDGWSNGNDHVQASSVLTCTQIWVGPVIALRK